MKEKPAKPDLFNSILKQGMTVRVEFNPWARNVSVPGHVKTLGQHQLLLKFDSVRCRGIRADSVGVEAGMKFGGHHWQVFVPWPAVFAISFEVGSEVRGVLYNDDVPETVLTAMVRQAELAEQQKLLDLSKPQQPKRASLEGGAKIYDLAEERTRRASKKPVS